MKLLQVWGHTERPWGYEVRADFDDSGVIHNEVLTFNKRPEEKDLTAAVESHQLVLEARFASLTKEKQIAKLQTDVSVAEAEISAAQQKKAELLIKIAATAAAVEPIVKPIEEGLEK